VITLAFYGQLSHTEIANQLGLPPETVKGRMRLGLQQLCADFEHTAACAVRRANAASSPLEFVSQSGYETQIGRFSGPPGDGFEATSRHRSGYGTDVGFSSNRQSASTASRMASGGTSTVSSSACTRPRSPRKTPSRRC